MKRLTKSMTKLVTLITLIGLCSTFALAQSSEATQFARYPLTAVGGSGIQGSVLLADYGLGNTVVTVLLSGTRATSDYPAHIHAGSCGTAGSIVYPLSNVSGPLGLSVTVVEAPFEELLTGDFYVNIHRSPRNLETIVACGNIGANAQPTDVQRLDAPAPEVIAPAEPEVAEPEVVAPEVTEPEVEPEPAEVEPAAPEVEAEPLTEPADDTSTLTRRIIQNEEEAGERFSSNDAVEFGAFVNDNYPEDATWVDNFAIALTYYAAEHEDGRVREYGPLNAVGLRFTELDIPEGATITEAYLELTAKSSRSDAVSINVTAQRDPNAPAFVDQELENISSRPTTFARHTWMTRDWTAGNTYRTGDLSALIEEVMSLDGWQSGNAIVFILTGTSTDNWQEAHSYRSGTEDERPRLVIIYELP
jgi:hypothetical protein